MPRTRLVALLLAMPSIAFAQDAPAAEPEVAEVAPATETRAPRIVVVVRGGDPTAEVIEAARALETLLVAAGMVLPTDEGMRAVLRGDVPASPEGYEPARAARLRLGWSPEGDREALAGIGRFVEADAVVVVTSTADAINVEVFDPGASDFYEGSTPIVSGDPSPAVPFVRSRARAALRRRVDPAAAARRVSRADARAATPEPLADEPPEEERWIKRNWPVILAGVLLAGTITYFVVSRRRDNDVGQPTIHIFPGGN